MRERDRDRDKQRHPECGRQMPSRKQQSGAASRAGMFDRCGVRIKSVGCHGVRSDTHRMRAWSDGQCDSGATWYALLSDPSA
eukprot:289608-Rhodomonas_salina.1